MFKVCRKKSISMVTLLLFVLASCFFITPISVVYATGSTYYVS